MQAICGFFRLDGKPADATELARLRAALVFNPRAHQGRFDGWGEGNVALGTAAWGGRSAGGDDSPLARHSDTGCVVVADARLDDCTALAKRLELRGDKPPTQAELILHAWLRWGEACADILRGDFAFAIWDPRERRLFCARDIMGVRPLYVHHQPGKLFAFASRAQALLALPDVPNELDEGRIADALTMNLEGVDKTCTFYRAISRLPPAHAADARCDRLKMRRYWRLEPDRVALPRTDAGWTKALIDVLEAAVARQLDGAARVGSMVSGGMDSSSVAVIAADQSAAAGRGSLPTFSFINRELNDPETRAALEMARLPRFQPVLSEAADVDADLEDFVAAAWGGDEPFDSVMLLAHTQYRSAAHAGVDAVLDGIDADTLFSAGGLMARQLKRLHWLGLYRNLRGEQRVFPDRPLAHALNGLVRAALVPAWARRVRARARSAHLPSPHRIELPATVLAPAFAQKVDLERRFERLAAWRRGSDRHALGHVAAERFDHPFITCGLERYHRVAAWHGVDPRHPFVDRDVLELGVNLPDRQRMRDGWTKACLREAMRGRLPESVRTRCGKEHLGWGLTERALLPSAEDARAELVKLEPILGSYVDGAKLAVALSHWNDRAAVLGKFDVLATMSLGRWLERHARAVADRSALA